MAGPDVADFLRAEGTAAHDDHPFGLPILEDRDICPASLPNMKPPADEQERQLAIVKQVLRDPPAVHLGAPDGVWRTQRRCYEFMSGEVRPGFKTLETGTGISTVLFTAWGCEHIAVVPSREESETILDYCSERGIDTSALTFDLRPSEVALPAMQDSGELDMVFIDGAHGFPAPIIDWFYGAGRLRKGGVVVFDDVQLPAVGSFLDSYIEWDPRWQRLGGTAKWRAYRRDSDGSLAEQQWSQQFYSGPKDRGWPGVVRRVKDAVPLSVRRRLK